jgi:phenol 2-monooxygenase
MIEDVLLEDLSSRGVSVTRNSPFISATTSLKSSVVESTCGPDSNPTVLKSNFVIGCDGAHSKVRRSIPGVEMKGESGKAAWGVLDGVLKTDFPDVWSKTAIHSSEHGAVLCIPRERNMTRLYIELHSAGEDLETQKAREAEGQEFVMRKARAILSPFKVEWESVGKFAYFTRLSPSPQFSLVRVL